MPNAKWYPAHTRYNPNSKNYLWIYIHPRKLNYESFLNDWQTRNILDAKEDPNLQKFYFLAPQELQDSISHQGEPLENIFTSIASKGGEASKAINLGKAAHKVDTPLIYQDSDRREISFVVNLGVYRNAATDVMEPIELLRAYSSPSLYGQSIWETKVHMPNVFKVVTVLGDGTVIPILNIQHAALTAVQPNFEGPYIQGYPSKCELTLTFKDMEPLSKESFGKVTVGKKSQVPYGVGAYGAGSEE